VAVVAVALLLLETLEMLDTQELVEKAEQEATAIQPGQLQLLLE
jgi:hypothetical protein